MKPDEINKVIESDQFPQWARDLMPELRANREMHYLNFVTDELVKYPDLLRVPVEQDEFVPMPEKLREIYPELPAQMPKRLAGHIQYAASEDLINRYEKMHADIRRVRQGVALNIANNFAYHAISMRMPDDTHWSPRAATKPMMTIYKILNGQANCAKDWGDYYREFDIACREEGVTPEAINAVTTIQDGVRNHIGGGVTNEVLLPAFFNLVSKGWHYKFLHG